MCVYLVYLHLSAHPPRTPVAKQRTQPAFLVVAVHTSAHASKQQPAAASHSPAADVCCCWNTTTQSSSQSSLHPYSLPTDNYPESRSASTSASFPVSTHRTVRQPLPQPPPPPPPRHFHAPSKYPPLLLAYILLPQLTHILLPPHRNAGRPRFPPRSLRSFAPFHTPPRGNTPAVT